MSLQSELKLRNLDCADLVTPLNRVTWNKREGYTLDRASCFVVQHNGPPYNEACHPEAHPTCSKELQQIFAFVPKSCPSSHRAWVFSVCTLGLSVPRLSRQGRGVASHISIFLQSPLRCSHAKLYVLDATDCSFSRQSCFCRPSTPRIIEPEQVQDTRPEHLLYQNSA